MVDFKMMFIGYFNHKEFMVRKLSAQSLISFTAKESLLSTLKILRDLVLTNATLNNFVHGCLLAMSHGAKLMKNEYTAMYKSSLAELIEIVGSIDRKLGTIHILRKRFYSTKLNLTYKKISSKCNVQKEILLF